MANCRRRKVRDLKAVVRLFAAALLVLLTLRSTSALAKLALPQTQASDYWEIDGYRIFHLETLAVAGAAPIVFLHGLPDHSLNQRRLIDLLAAKHGVVAYDRKGMGLSDKPPLAYDLPSQVRELEAVLTARGMNQVVLIGHSVGGTLATMYTAEHPERVRALVVMNPVIFFEPGHTGLRQWDTWILHQPLVGESLMAFQNRWVTKAILKHLFYDDQRVTPELVNAYHFPFQMKGAKQHFLGTLRSFYELKTATFLAAAEQVNRWKVPTLVVWTERDAEMPVADGRDLAQRMNAKILTIPECGHLPQLELSEARLQSDLVEPLETFLSEIPAL